MISVHYVARGVPANNEAVASITSLRRFHDWRVSLLTDQWATFHRADTLPGGPLPGVCIESLYGMVPGCDPGGRMAKISLLDFHPDASHVLYLDADTRVINRLPFGEMSGPRVGFDIAICASEAQGDQAMWHIGEDEREQTKIELSDPAPLCYNAGVFLIANTARTREFCGVWLEEWYRWRGQDQAAFLRALHRVPLRMWILGREFNGGALIQHRFGEATDAQTKTARI